MLVNITPSPGTLIKVVTKDGKTLTDEDIKSISFDPYFQHRGETSTFAKVESMSDKRGSVDSCMLVVSGRSGKISRREEAIERVKPMIDEDDNDVQPEPDVDE